jgi:hypothetical protein
MLKLELTLVGNFPKKTPGKGAGKTSYMITIAGMKTAEDCDTPMLDVVYLKRQFVCWLVKKCCPQKDKISSIVVFKEEHELPKRGVTTLQKRTAAIRRKRLDELRQLNKDAEEQDLQGEERKEVRLGLRIEPVSSNLSSSETFPIKSKENLAGNQITHDQQISCKFQALSPIQSCCKFSSQDSRKKPIENRAPGFCAREIRTPKVRTSACTSCFSTVTQPTRIQATTPRKTRSPET